MKVEVVAIRGNIAELRINGKTVFVPHIIQGSQVSFAYDGETYTVDVGASRRRARHRDHSMSAPMPGVILKILVSQGETVTKGAPLVILEAMKMEHVIVATRDGTIEAINCREGELVQPGFDLIDLK
jgi:3-methylcrotonyl-CoA carboxylase alpha subunit